MKVQLSRFEYSKNGNRKEVQDETFYIPKKMQDALSIYARRYRTTKGGMINMILAYYFADGNNHLGCEFCNLAEQMGCMMPDEGGQTTLPLLDNGSVVVGLPTADQVK